MKYRNNNTKKEKQKVIILNDDEITLLSNLYFELKEIKNVAKMMYITTLNLTTIESVIGINTPDSFVSIDDGLKVLSKDIVDRLENTSKSFDDCYLDIIKK